MVVPGKRNTSLSLFASVCLVSILWVNALWSHFSSEMLNLTLFFHAFDHLFLEGIVYFNTFFSLSEWFLTYENDNGKRIKFCENSQNVRLWGGWRKSILQFNLFHTLMYACPSGNHCLQSSFADFVLMPKVLPLSKNKNIYRQTLFELFFFYICLQSLVMILMRKPVSLLWWPHLIFLKNSITQHDYLSYLVSLALNACWLLPRLKYIFREWQCAVTELLNGADLEGVEKGASNLS